MSEYIEFRDAGTSPSGKTRVWNVVTKPGGYIIGKIAWWAAWRRYALHPEDGSVFEQDCLRTIASFCETETQEHKGK